MKDVAVLGSCGSIGKQALSVIRAFPDRMRAAVLCTRRDAETLILEAREFAPDCVAVADAGAAARVRQALPALRVIEGPEAASEAARLGGVDIVVNGVAGFAGVKPLLSALEAGKDVALANKESVVCARSLVREALKKGGRILPVDSEQSAFFQCMQAGGRDEVKRLILTASGGPFRGWDAGRLKAVTAAEALKHPTWSMGRKITLDSATLFNKGLEIMEASFLFDIPGERIDVVVHPQSVVHSLVEFQDGSLIAQMSRPDMRLAIQYALTWPERIPGGFGGLDLPALRSLDFEAVDTRVFRSVPLAYEALKNDVLPIVYNAASEVAAEAFFCGRIGFLDIQAMVEHAMKCAPAGAVRTLRDVEEIDGAARRCAAEFRR